MKTGPVGAELYIRTDRHDAANSGVSEKEKALRVTMSVSPSVCNAVSAAKQFLRLS